MQEPDPLNVIDLSKLVCEEQPLSYGATADYPWSDDKAKRYRFKSRFGEEVLLYDRDFQTGRIKLPRALCPIPTHNDIRTLGAPVHFPKAPTPRDYQVPLFNTLAAALNTGKSGLVEAFTGFGKTFAGYHAAYTVQRATLVITTKDDIFNQWIEDAPAALGIDKSDIGTIRANKFDIEDKKFVVAMIHSMSKTDRYPSWMKNYFGLVIFDECQRVPADSFQRVASIFTAFWRLGMSATLQRKDGKEALVSAHIGDVIARSAIQLQVPKVLRFKSPWVCPLITVKDKKTGEFKKIQFPHAPARTARIESMMIKDYARNAKLVDMIIAAYEKGRCNAVFSSQHEHLIILRKALIKAGVADTKIGAYIHATTKAEIAEREEASIRPIVLTTPNMMGEGTNLPWLDTCTLATPRADVTQMIGRIRREFEGKQDPVVMDLVDDDSHLFANYAISREKSYKRLGCVVKDLY